MILRRLSKSHFNRLADTTQLEDRGRQMAHDFFVRGLAPVQVAATYGVSRQRVLEVIGVIRRAYERSGGAGTNPLRDVVSIELSVPDSLAQALTLLANNLKQSKVSGEKKQAAKKAMDDLSKAITQTAQILSSLGSDY